VLAATTSAVCTSCPANSWSLAGATSKGACRPVLPLAFDATLVLDRRCLGATPAEDLIPIQAFIAVYLEQMRVENSVSAYVYAVLLMAGAQMSSCPAPIGRWGTALYCTWTLCFLLQAVCAVLVMAMLGLSVSHFEDAHADCAISFWGGRSLLSWFAALTAAFHPAVLAIMSQIFVGRDMLLVAEYAEGAEESSMRHFPLGRIVGAVGTLVCGGYLLWLVVSGVGFVIFGTFAFGVMFVPISLALGAAFAAFALPFFKLMQRLQLLDPSRCRGKAKLIVSQAKNVGSLFYYESDGQWNRVWVGVTALFLFSPLPFFGGLAALRCYAGADADPAATGALVRLVYGGAFDAFSSVSFRFPSFALPAFALRMPQWNWSPADFIAGATAYLSLNAMLGLFRGLSSAATYALFAIDKGGQRLAAPLGMAKGRNAISGVPLRDLFNPFVPKQGRMREKPDGGREMVAPKATAAFVDPVEEAIKLGDLEQALSKAQNGYGGGKALLLAAEQGRLELVQQLLAAGANTEAVNERGETAVVVAAGAGHAEVCAALAAAGADVAAAGGGRAALHAASAAGHEGAVRALLEAGAAVDT
jgi:hypothetical protein